MPEPTHLAPPPSTHPQPPAAGLPEVPPQPGQYPVSAPGNTLAITGFVLALASLPLCLVPVVNFVGVGVALAGLVLAILGLLRTRTGAPRRGLAIAGIVVGGVGMLGGTSSAVVYTVLSHQAATQWEQAMADLDRADGSATEELLAEDLAVEFGAFEVGADEFGIVTTALPVTLTSTTDQTQEYFVTIEAVDGAGDRIVDELVTSYALGPGQSVTIDAFTYLSERELERLRGAEFRVAQVSAH